MNKLRSTVSVAALVVASLTLRVGADQNGAGSARLQLVEATIGEMQKALQTKLLTTEQLVGMYLNRIAAYEATGPAVNAYIHLNENAISQARLADGLRHPGIARSPLEGI